MEAAQTIATIRDRILQYPDLRKVEIDLSDHWPAVGEPLFVKLMSAAERSAYELSMDFDAEGKPQARLNIQTKLAVRTLVDIDGERVFADEDIDELAAKSSEAVQLIFEAAAEINGLTKESIGALEKNSEGTTSDT